MKVLVACEESQVVTKAFRDRGHEAYSCDILPCSGGHPEWHLQQDVVSLLKQDWDLLIAHPPCTYLSYAATRWWNLPGRAEKREEAMQFFLTLYNASIEKICVENPVGYPNTVFQKPSQIIQPYYFGDTESKRTCLWLKNLPLLISTNIVKPKIYAYYKRGKKKGLPIYGNNYLKFSEDRGRIRSKTFLGIANAMAEQWG